jgi:catechol 2,3-dioxygenase-like lactoylglutathione lyase family enzyme
MTPVMLDHLQIAMPGGGESAARAFYGSLLGLPEVAKPAVLRDRGGLWFMLGGGIGFHLGVEADFRPAVKAHPALRLTHFAETLVRLEAAGHEVKRDRDPFGRARAYVADPFGNRLELIEEA